MAENSIRVSATEYPAVFKAFLEIDYDSGMIDRNNPEPVRYWVPIKWAKLLLDAEKQLWGLTTEERQLLCAGEESEQQALIRRRGLKETDRLLNLFFEEDWRTE